jgi:hypothetical protein
MRNKKDRHNSKRNRIPAPDNSPSDKHTVITRFVVRPVQPVLRGNQDGDVADGDGWHRRATVKSSCTRYLADCVDSPFFSLFDYGSGPRYLRGRPRVFVF